jgi:hypothetical protein
MLVATHNALYVSKDNGSTASRVLEDSCAAFRSLVVGSDRTIYACAGTEYRTKKDREVQCGGLFVSRNDGQTWERISSLSESLACYGLCIARDGTLILAASSGVFVSNNKGLNWQKWENDFGGVSCATISARGNIFVGTRNAGIYRSADNGKTWHGGGSGAGDYPHCILVSSDGHVYVGSQNFGLRRRAIGDWDPES